MRKTKIICTIGPASSNEETLRRMMLGGMNVARLNFSHGSYEEHKYKIDLIKSVLEYTERHYNSPITLNELAAVAGMNPRYFCRFFRSITHQTPIEYVNMYRIEKAAQMLHNTRLPITDICMECGFNDSSNFIKVFRKYKGTTPNQYRKN